MKHTDKAMSALNKSWIASAAIVGFIWLASASYNQAMEKGYANHGYSKTDRQSLAMLIDNASIAPARQKHHLNEISGRRVEHNRKLAEAGEEADRQIAAIKQLYEGAY